MTLNVTVVTRHRIYQCADYRLYDWNTGRISERGQDQKIHVISRENWDATICFNGVGSFEGVHVSTWLAERLASIEESDPIERLYDELQKADDWLSRVPPPHNRHSFVIGAFVGAQPLYALVTNYEDLSGSAAGHAEAALKLLKKEQTSPRTFVSGQRQAIPQETKARLAALASLQKDPQVVMSALAQANQIAAKAYPAKISNGCFATCLRRTGEGWGRAYDIAPVIAHPIRLPQSLQEAVRAALTNRYVPGTERLIQMAHVRLDLTSEDFHLTQLRDKPNDPDVHSNYGNFLRDHKKDLEGAEREYRRALELNDTHVNALGNLANVLWDTGDELQADDLYRRALKLSPTDENIGANYSKFLYKQRKDAAAAEAQLKFSIEANPNSHRLVNQLAGLYLQERRPTEALTAYGAARELGADQKEVEAGYAGALHLSGAPAAECIAAYRTAIALDPDNRGLRLNLAQLLFLIGGDDEAKRLLRAVGETDLPNSDQLEYEFYRLAHTDDDPSDAIRSMRNLLTAGARLNWDVQRNVEEVRVRDPRKAALLQSIAQIASGQQAEVDFERILQELRPNR
jgi:tetratricopeptide (TPR) repeat protein